MLDQLIITRDELVEYVQALLDYNKRVEGLEFRFVTSDGETLLKDFQLVVTIEAAPLKVRTLPEDEDDDLRGIGAASLEQAIRMANQWRKNRGEPSILKPGATETPETSLSGMS